MAGLKLNLLGPPRIEVEDKTVEIQRRKVLALLVYLAVTGEPQRRDTLATLLWPDSSQRSARTALRRDLSILNKTLAGTWLIIERETIELRTGSDFWLDVDQFQQQVSDCVDNTPTCLETLTGAVNLYRDDFLTGFTLPNCLAFDEWQFFQTEGLRQELATALERLVHVLSLQDRFEVAIPYARRQLALDSLHEPAHRRLMQLYAWTGQRAAALRQYGECLRLLAEELGVPPSEETTKLYQAIKTKQTLPVPSLTRGGPTDPPSITPNREVESDNISLPYSSSRDELEVGATAQYPASISDNITKAVAIEGSDFVVREGELARLGQYLTTALAGRGQIAFVTGEAGSGKTTLAHEFAHRAQNAFPELIVAGGVCNVYTGVGDPYLPFREILSQLTGDMVGAGPAGGILSQANARRLEALAPVVLQALVDVGPDLIGSFIPDRAILARAAGLTGSPVAWLGRLQELIERKAAQTGPVTPEQNRLFEHYTGVLQTLAVRQPLLLILDDLHWADISSISLLFHLGRRIDQSRILIVGSYRPEDIAQDWAGQPHPLKTILSEFRRHFGDTRVDLDQAGQAEGRAFVEALLDTEPNRLAQTFRQALYQHSRGHPLFTIELLRDMQERADVIQDEQGRWIEGASLAWDALPARVEGVIEKRISRLDIELQEALTVAGVEGEAFTAEVVARVQGLDQRSFVRRLSGELDKQHRLVRERGVRQLGPGGRLSLYQFRHNLFQKYLYNRLGQVERAYLHEAVGEALETLYGEQTEGIAVQLARHFQEAGLTEKAVDYLLQAGQRATRLSANEEAIDHFTRGLTLLKDLPDIPERAQQELTLLLALSRPLTRLRGYSAPEVEQIYTQAWELCRQVGETPELFPVLRGLWDYYLIRAEGYKARELGQQLLDLARRAEDSIQLMEAHWLLGETLFFMGEISAALKHQEEAIARYNPQQYRAYPYRAAQDPGLASRYFRASTLWVLGYPDQALTSIHDTLALAHELAKPFELANTLHFVIEIYRFRREVQAAQARVAQFIALSTGQGFEMWVPNGIILRGWALAAQGQVEEGIAEMLAGRDVMRGELALLSSADALAEAYVKVGRAEEGLALLVDSLDAVDKSGYRLFEAEMYRLKGELLQLQCADESEVEACFRRAIDIARRQQAKSWELRATVSLSRLLQKQGEPAEARQILAAIYNWFTEGFDTADLQEARALLDDLDKN